MMHMKRYVVLFRLPLAPGSCVVEALVRSGWQCISDSAFVRSVRLDAEEVTEEIKELCRDHVDRGMSAFAVIPLREREPRYHSMLD